MDDIYLNARVTHSFRLESFVEIPYRNWPFTSDVDRNSQNGPSSARLDPKLYERTFKMIHSRWFSTQNYHPIVAEGLLKTWNGPGPGLPDFYFRDWTNLNLLRRSYKCVRIVELPTPRSLKHLKMFRMFKIGYNPNSNAQHNLTWIICRNQNSFLAHLFRCLENYHKE